MKAQQYLDHESPNSPSTPSSPSSPIKVPTKTPLIPKGLMPKIGLLGLLNGKNDFRPKEYRHARPSRKGGIQIFGFQSEREISPIRKETSPNSPSSPIFISKSFGINGLLLGLLGGLLGLRKEGATR